MPSDDWNPQDCTVWCDTNDSHNHDPACWGQDYVGQEVLLSMEDGFPREAVEPYDVAWIRKHDNAPYVGVYAYRERPGHREVVYLYLNRESDNEFRNIDCSVHLTGQEAVQLANHLLGVAAVVDPGLRNVTITPEPEPELVDDRTHRLGEDAEREISSADLAAAALARETAERNYDRIKAALKLAARDCPECIVRDAVEGEWCDAHKVSE